MGEARPPAPKDGGRRRTPPAHSCGSVCDMGGGRLGRGLGHLSRGPALPCIGPGWWLLSTSPTPAWPRRPEPAAGAALGRGEQHVLLPQDG